MEKRLYYNLFTTRKIEKMLQQQLTELFQQYNKMWKVSSLIDQLLGIREKLRE